MRLKLTPRVFSLLLFGFISSNLFASDLSGTYHLKTQFRGDGECLEGNQAASSVHGGAAFMDQCKNVSGQVWNIEAAGNGFYRLKTAFRGNGECLEGNQAASSVHNGAAFMDQCKNVSGQLWKFEPAGNGFYRLKTMFRGEGECLEGNQAASNVHNGAAFMDSCKNVSGQLWKLEKVSSAGPNLVMHFDFNNPAKPIDQTGNFHDLQLEGNARLENGALIVTSDGRQQTGWAHATVKNNLTIKDKTLIAQVRLNDLDIGSGSVLTLDNTQGDNFDGIVYAERKPRTWMAGSTHFQRTSDVVTTRENKVRDEVWISISYKLLAPGKNEITICRNGQQIGQYIAKNQAVFSGSGNFEFIAGKRHTNGNYQPGLLSAEIHDVKVYDAAMTCKEAGAPRW